MKNVRFKFNVSNRVKTGLTLSTAALAFSLIALSGGKMNAKIIAAPATANLTPEAAEKIVMTEQQRQKNVEAVKERNELLRQLDSGVRTPEEISGEMREAIGDGAPIEFTKSNFDRAYKLSAVLSHVRSRHLKPYEVLFIHSFKNENLAEDATTQYTRRIDGAEEANTASKMNFPRVIEIGDKQQPAVSNKALYIFALDRNALKKPFEYRDPEGLGGFDRANATSLDPLALLGHDEFFSNGSYQKQVIDADSRIWNVKATVRKTEIGTVSVEVFLQEVGSSMAQTSVLVYEEL